MGLFDQVGNFASKGAGLAGQATNLGILGSVATGRVQKLFGGDDKTPTSSKPIEDTGIRGIGEFISMVKNEGLAQDNNFTFTFAVPAQIIDSSKDVGDINYPLLNLMCYATELPSINIGTTPIKYFGHTIEMPDDKNYGTINSTFYVDTSMYVKLFFDRWIDYIRDPSSGVFKFYDNYTTDVVISVFDKHGYMHYMVILSDAYPKSIAAVPLSQDSREIMKISVEWSYTTFLSYKVENPIHGKGKANTEKTPTLAQRLMGYAGQFKDYQNRFNNLSGDISRTQNLIKTRDFGGLVGQNLGGGWQ